jgi:translation initiation factor 2 alpha subunit (eIF-2alpha)
MKTFSTYEAARQLHKLFDAKALLNTVDQQIHPTLDEDLEARAAQCDVEVDAMNHAEDGIAFLNKVLQKVAGTDVWPQAMEIAYAPNDIGGYQRVAEYYLRAEKIINLAARTL